jgi:hypothetical protein
MYKAGLVPRYVDGSPQVGGGKLESVEIAKLAAWYPVELGELVPPTVVETDGKQYGVPLYDAFYAWIPFIDQLVANPPRERRRLSIIRSGDPDTSDLG